MHGIDQITQMDIFYHALNYASIGIIDGSCYGAFERKCAKEANQLIEGLAKRNYIGPSKTLGSGSSSRLRGCGVIELNKMSAIEAKLDALMNKVSIQERRNQSAYLVETVEDEQRVLNDEGVANDGPYHVEEVQFVNGNRSYNCKPNTNLPTHYTQLCGTMRMSYMDLQYNSIARRKICVELLPIVWLTWLPRIEATKQQEN